MRYAEVSVNSPAAQRRTFSYSIPSGLDVHPGQAVLVPFGERDLQGIVLELSPFPAVEDTRDIIEIIESEPVLSPVHLSLARWISKYYLSSFFEALALMLPPGFERKAVTYFSLARQSPDITHLNKDQKLAIDLAVDVDRVELKRLEKTLGRKKAQAAISALVRQGVLIRSYELAPVRVRPKTEIYLSLNEDSTENAELTAKQTALVEFLQDQTGPVSWADTMEKTGCSRSVVNTLVRKGLVSFHQIEVRREPISYDKITVSHRLKLTTNQQTAFDAIKSGLQTKRENSPPAVFLLHGVTGSGKTEIYLQALAATIEMGKKGIVLVPEIALTPQTIERFASRFPQRVAVLHSKLSLGERYDEWHRIRRGEFDVVIGSRSAIFAPQPDLGLIVLDEEHEWTYKQDTSPHYHARDVAMKLADLMGAVVVLGSATPDVETYYQTQKSDYQLLTLAERVVPAVGAALPQVEVVDMREELKAGNRSIFSRVLTSAINEAVAAEEQVILFLNRRGGATFIQCRKCGFILRCRRCDVPLSQHPADDILVCHQCNYKIRTPQICPNCSSRQFKFLGTGTQKLEQEVKYAFPRARQLRWDSDMIVSRASHETILQQFRERQADILVGTQMVAKGLDIPSVTLVGVIIADTSLNLPDFRAGERTFQLLSQVAGRAGRGASGGRVIIQTYSPEHYAIHGAANHDYTSFFRQEISYRQKLHNPPFSRLTRLMYIHINDSICQRETERMKKLLMEEIDTKGISDVEIIGPAPAFVHRLRGRYRWQLILRGFGLSEFLTHIYFPQGWSIDIDPIGLVQ